MHYEEKVLIYKHNRQRSMVDHNATNIVVMRHVMLKCTMNYYVILVFYAGINFVLDCNLICISND